MDDDRTPMLRQYQTIKAQHPDAILMFRLGDFYEMFYDDAQVASRTLSLTLTSRGRGTRNEAPMCGVPYHAADAYIARLIREGFRVAICDQIEDARNAKGIVRRAVTRVLSPGTVTDEQQLQARSPNYIAALFWSGDPGEGEVRGGIGAAFLDLSTGDFRLSEHRGPRARETLAAQVALFAPSEIVHAEGRPPAGLLSAELMEKILSSAAPAWAFASETARKALLARLGTASLQGFGCEDADLAVGAAGGLLFYLQETQKTDLRHLTRVTLLQEGDAMTLDATTRRTLELTENARDGGRDGTLLEILDRTGTAMGGRMLRDWLLRPLPALAAIETRERARTGIASLKVRYNRVFGYYIEVSHANRDRVPADYERRQTLVGAERYATPELKEYEAKVLTAQERIAALEFEAFVELRAEVAAAAPRLRRAARIVATLDTQAALAETAVECGYVRPRLDAGRRLTIRDGRHPVVERLLRAERFVPNDCLMDPEERQILILTGPNMGGKSTYLREGALIVLLAQVGSFVPAAEAESGLVDRIFSRVGASDNLARGQSTFLVEMNETANILNNATERSLILLDEVGRGTSTFDGLSIAWSVAEHLHDTPSVAARTLFATHYHEMTELALLRPRVKNLTMAVREWNDTIVFLRKVLEGAADRSYGIQGARLAGLPREVIERAKEVLLNLETEELSRDGRPKLARHLTAEGSDDPAAGTTPAQLGLFAPPEDPILTCLRQLNLYALTPLEALNQLADMKKRIDGA